MVLRSASPQTYRPLQEPAAVQPWAAFEYRRPSFISSLKIEATEATHCFSVCLYHEPEFAVRFRARDFKARYLSCMEDLSRWLRDTGYALNIFTDAEMAETALKFGCGSVYLVSAPPQFPFAQHLWRYYSALLPDHDTIKAYHFRGLDNVMISEPERKIIARMVEDDAGLMHAPYLRKNGEVYTPVRGSFSVAHEGIRALRWYLSTTPQPMPSEEWPEAWHSDENYLTGFYQAAARVLNTYTIVDRKLPMEFYADFHQRFTNGYSNTIVTVP
jgi:hypothetical protein